METDQITAVSSDRPHILLPKEYARDFWARLTAPPQRVPCMIPEDAVFTGNKSTDSVINADLTPKQLDGTIDRWFELLEVKPTKHADADPERITWEYDRDEYGKAVGKVRGGFLKPGTPS